jgi:hypothetical protein
VPDAEPNTNAITRWNRTAIPTSIVVPGLVNPLTYPPPKKEQLCWLWKRDVKPSERLAMSVDIQARIKKLDEAFSRTDPKRLGYRREGLTKPLRMDVYHQAMLLATESLNHLLACIEASRMASHTGGLGPVGNRDAQGWKTFKEEQHTKHTISEVMNWFSLEGVPFDSDPKPAQGRAGVMGQQLTIVGQGRAHMRDILRGLGSQEHHTIHLLIRRCPYKLTEAPAEEFRFATRQSEFADMGYTRIQPNPWNDNDPRTHVLYPVQIVPVSRSEQGPVPSSWLRYKSYDDEEFVDGKSLMLGRISHVGVETASGYRPGYQPPKKGTEMPGWLADPPVPRDAYKTQTSPGPLEMMLLPSY